jgi:hypothetical protein
MNALDSFHPHLDTPEGDTDHRGHPAEGRWGEGVGTHEVSRGAEHTLDALGIGARRGFEPGRRRLRLPAVHDAVVI